MMQCIVALALALVLVPTIAASDDVTIVTGQVTYVTSEVVEVAGRRGLISSGTAITSDGRAISLAAIQVGIPAELEIDPSGQALELRVKGAVE
jgi:hypothetical protein